MSGGRAGDFFGVGGKENVVVWVRNKRRAFRGCFFELLVVVSGPFLRTGYYMESCKENVPVSENLVLREHNREDSKGIAKKDSVDKQEDTYAYTGRKVESKDQHQTASETQVPSMFCSDSSQRYTLFPIRHPEIWKMYKKHEVCYNSQKNPLIFCLLSPYFRLHFGLLKKSTCQVIWKTGKS